MNVLYVLLFGTTGENFVGSGNLHMARMNLGTPYNMVYAALWWTYTKATCGRLIGWAKRKRELASRGQAPPQLVQKDFDKAGKRRYKGTSKLRSSEWGS